MTIAASETAVQSSDIFEVYDFTHGTDHYYYTSDFEDRIVDGVSYSAEAIERTGFPYASGNSVLACTITIPNTNALAVLLRPTSEQRPLSVSIKRYFTDDLANAENIFIGYASGINFQGGICTIEFKTIMLEIERAISRVRMQSLCNNQLFDSTCALLSTDTDKQTSAIVTVSVDGKTLSSATFGAKDTGFFTGGKVLYNGTYRYISLHSGNDLTIQYAFDGLADGESVTAWLGCDKLPATCISKFKNLVNYVGMPYIPLKDSEKVALTHG